MTEFHEPEVTYPRAHAQLVGADGNTLVLAGIVVRAIKDAGYGNAAANEFFDAVLSCGSYDEFLRLAMRTVVVS